MSDHPVKVRVEIQWSDGKSLVHTGDSVEIKAQSLYPRELKVISHLSSMVQFVIRELNK